MRVPPPTMLGVLGLRTHEIFYFCSSRSLGCCPTTSLSAPSDRNVGSLWRFGHCACISVPLRGCLAFHFDLHAAVDARVDGFGSVGSSVDCGVEKITRAGETTQADFFVTPRGHARRMRWTDAGVAAGVRSICFPMIPQVRVR